MENDKLTNEKLVNNVEEVQTQADFENVELTDCDVPINCPFGWDPSEDLFPNHH